MYAQSYVHHIEVHAMHTDCSREGEFPRVLKQKKKPRVFPTTLLLFGENPASLCFNFSNKCHSHLGGWGLQV